MTSDPATTPERPPAGVLLAIESIGRSGSVAVVDAGGAVLAERSPDGPAGANLVPDAIALLRAHPSVTAIAVATGPGSFTGLRIAVVAARTLAWQTGLPVLPVDSAAAIAAAAGPGTWVVCLPLKRDTTFHGWYQVADSGEITVRHVAAPQLDTQPGLAVDASTVVIGPAVSDRPAVVAQWYPDQPCGSSASATAVGVALAARSAVAQPIDAVMPDYRIASAPELQRRAGIS